MIKNMVFWLIIVINIVIFLKLILYFCIMFLFVLWDIDLYVMLMGGLLSLCDLILINKIV